MPELKNRILEKMKEGKAGVGFRVGGQDNTELVFLSTLRTKMFNY